MFSFISSTFFSIFHRKNDRSISSLNHASTDSLQVQVVTTTESTTDLPSTSQAQRPVAIPITPPPAAYYSPVQIQSDMMSEFFGGRPKKARSRDSAPPPYASQSELEKLPSYPGHPHEEPASLARFMFVYGFLFPPFWIMGVVILCSPLRATPDWETGRTDEEKARLLAEMRAAELKWAKRCLAALTVLVTVVALVAVIGFLADRP